MTWEKANDLTVEEVASLTHLILYTAIDGMEGSDIESFQNEDGGLKYDGYWHGCVETAARSMAFIFAGTKYTSDEGVSIGDAVHHLMIDLERAALHLMDSPKEKECPTCKRPFDRKKRDPWHDTNEAERAVDVAATKFFGIYAPVELAEEIQDALRKQQKMREDTRRKLRYVSDEA